MSDDQSKMIQPLAKIHGLSQSSALNAIKPSTEHLKPISVTQKLNSVSKVESSTSVEQITSSSAVSQLFDELIALHYDELQGIALQVMSGHLTESQGEEYLLRLALTHSLNIPPLIAESMLPELKASLDDLPLLRQGLRRLWSP